MDELIRITTNEQGSLVVSARELHEQLGVKARFNDWIKRRIIKYGLLEGVDYVEVKGSAESPETGEGVLLNFEYNPGGRPETDYGLNLDTAKELCMVENNEQGRTMRRYFIKAEKKLRQVIATPPAPALDPTVVLQLLTQQTQLLTEQQRLATDQQSLIAQLRADVDQIMLSGHRPARHGSSQQLGLPGLSARPPRERPASLRQIVNRTVNAYCDLHGATQSETYGYLYRRLYDVHRINVNQLKRTGKESLLDALERYGYLDRLVELIRTELTERGGA